MSALEQEHFVALGDNADFSLPGVEDFLNGDDEVLETIFTHVNSTEIIYEPQRKRAKLIGEYNCPLLKFPVCEYHATLQKMAVALSTQNR